MTQTAPVIAAAPRLTPADGDVVQNAIRDAGFPEGIDASTLFQPAQLSTDTPSVAHLLIAQGIKAYDVLGKNITEAIENVNLASGRKMTLTSINGEFLSINSDAVKAAMADPEQRRALIAAFEKLNEALAAPAATARAGLPPPKVRAATTPAPDSVQAVPPTTVPAANRTTTLPPPTAASATTPQPVRELPEHPILDGVSKRWKHWFAQGQHAPQTLALLLPKKKAADIERDLPAALDEVQREYNIGQPGCENLEKAIMSLQEAMQPLGYSGQPEGQWGGETERVRKSLIEQRRSAPDSLQEITNPVLRKVLHLDEPAPKAVATRPGPAAPAPPPQAAPPPAALAPTVSPPPPPPPPSPAPAPASFAPVQLNLKPFGAP